VINRVCVAVVGIEPSHSSFLIKAYSLGLFCT